MKIAVNFADVQSKAVIPADTYNGVISDVVAREKAGSEHPYLNWEVTIADGDYEGRKVYLITTLKPEGLWNLQTVLQNLGFEATEADFPIEIDDTTMQLTSPEVIGLPCQAVVFNEPYNGRMTSKISSILGPNGEDVTGQAAATEAAAETKSAARPATKATVAPKSNGTAKRSPFPATAGAKRVFK